jgi:uncharacterized protein YdcH (DUF465 family)
MLEHHPLVKEFPDIEPVSDDFRAQLKRRRLYLKDRLLQMMREATEQTR